MGQIHSKQYLSSLLVFGLGVFTSGAAAVWAQARIDPSLPEAPLPQKRAWFVSPGYGAVMQPETQVPPLRPRQKFEMAFGKIMSPSTLVRAGFASEFDRGFSVGPFYAPGGRGFAQLMGYNAANFASATLFTDAVLPVLFHQDPRYFRKGSGSIKSRVGWALRSEAVAFSDKGTETPNLAGMLGYGMSAGLSVAYLPPENVSFWKTMEGWGIKEAISSGFRVFSEFGGMENVKKRLRQKFLKR